MKKTLILRPGAADLRYWQDLWSYRELFLILAWRDLTVRYKQTVIGISWALLRPLFTMVVFTVLFGSLAKLPSEGGAPYAVMVLCGLLPWTFFASAVADASNSLVANAHLISKVYFPRSIVPASTVVVSGVDFIIGLALLLFIMACYGRAPGWQIIFVPAFAFVTVLLSLGLGLWTAALNVKYRDLRYVTAFALQAGIYVSPIGFSSQIVPDKWRLLYSLNPLVGIIDGFRWSVIGDAAAVYWPGVGISIAISALLFWIGLSQFRAMQNTMADYI